MSEQSDSATHRLVSDFKWALFPGSIKHRELPNWALTWVLVCNVIWAFTTAIILAWGQLAGEIQFSKDVAFALGLVVATVMLIRGLAAVNQVSA